MSKKKAGESAIISILFRVCRAGMKQLTNALRRTYGADMQGVGNPRCEHQCAMLTGFVTPWYKDAPLRGAVWAGDTSELNRPCARLFRAHLDSPKHAARSYSLLTLRKVDDLCVSSTSSIYNFRLAASNVAAMPYQHTSSSALYSLPSVYDLSQSNSKENIINE